MSMKKIILFCVALLGMVSCSDQLTENDVANGVQTVNSTSDTIWRKPVGAMLLHS